MKRKILVVAMALAIASCSSSNDSTIPVDGSSAPTDDTALPADTTTPDGAAPDNDGTTVEPIALEVVGQNLLVSLAGFQADRLSLTVRELAEEIAADGEAMPLTASTFETLDGFGPEVVVSPTQITAYTCNAGGQMTHETGRLRNGVGSELSLRGDYDAYSFDACRHSGVGGLFAAGDYQLDGQLTMDGIDYSASRGSRSSHSNTWVGFSMTAPEGLAYELSGSVSASEFSAANFGSGDLRTVELSSYRKTSGTQLNESLEGVRLTLTRTIPNGGSESGYQLDANGAVADSTTNGQTVTINTDPILSGRNQFAQGILEPFSGQMRIVVDDGSELILSANVTSQISTEAGALLVDLLAMRPNGESIASDAVPLIDILTGNIDSQCFLDDSSDGNCAIVELP